MNVVLIFMKINIVTLGLDSGFCSYSDGIYIYVNVVLHISEIGWIPLYGMIYAVFGFESDIDRILLESSTVFDFSESV